MKNHIASELDNQSRRNGQIPRNVQSLKTEREIGYFIK